MTYYAYLRVMGVVGVKVEAGGRGHLRTVLPIDKIP